MKHYQIGITTVRVTESSRAPFKAVHLEQRSYVADHIGDSCCVFSTGKRLTSDAMAIAVAQFLNARPELNAPHPDA